MLPLLPIGKLKPRETGLICSESQLEGGGAGTRMIQTQGCLSQESQRRGLHLTKRDCAFSFFLKPQEVG